MEILVPLEYSIDSLINKKFSYDYSPVGLNMRETLLKITNDFCAYRYVYIGGNDNNSSKLEHGVERSTYPESDVNKKDNPIKNKYTNPYNCKYNIFIASEIFNNSCKGSQKIKKIEYIEGKYLNCNPRSCDRSAPCIPLIEDHMDYFFKNEIILMPNYWYHMDNKKLYFDIKDLEFKSNDKKISQHKTNCKLNELSDFKKIMKDHLKSIVEKKDALEYLKTISGYGRYCNLIEKLFIEELLKCKDSEEIKLVIRLSIPEEKLSEYIKEVEKF